MTNAEPQPGEENPVFSAKDLQKALQQFYVDRADQAASATSEIQQRRADLIKILQERVITREEMNAARSTARLLEAAQRGEKEKEIFRFPNQLTTDHGRAINNSEPGWPETLMGVPRQVYDFWAGELKPLGFRLRAQIVDFPDGLPGDIGFTIAWD